MLGLPSPHAVGMGIDTDTGRNISRVRGQWSLKTDCAFMVGAEILAVIGWRVSGAKVDRVRACVPKIWMAVVLVEMWGCRLPANPKIVGYRSYHD